MQLLLSHLDLLQPKVFSFPSMKNLICIIGWRAQLRGEARGRLETWGPNQAGRGFPKSAMEEISAGQSM